MSLCHVKGVAELVETVDSYTETSNPRVVNHFSRYVNFMPLDMNASRVSAMISLKRIGPTDIGSGQGLEIMLWDVANLLEWTQSKYWSRHITRETFKPTFENVGKTHLTSKQRDISWYGTGFFLH